VFVSALCICECVPAAAAGPQQMTKRTHSPAY